MIISLIKKIRAIIMRSLWPQAIYMASDSVYPISRKYGFDRGMPVDRFYIEAFMESVAALVKGACLEIVDSSYTRKYGGSKVTRSDVLDIIKRPTTTIYGDLRNVQDTIADNTYDTVIITQTFNVIDDYEAAIKECHRILKPGGALIVTMPTISPAWNLKINMWRMNAESAAYTFGKYFDPAKVTVKALGNKVSTEYFWVGMAIEDMNDKEMHHNDDQYPTIIGIVAIK
jgi:SAM-dependent methyltransferase